MLLWGEIPFVQDNKFCSGQNEEEETGTAALQVPKEDLRRLMVHHLPAAVQATDLHQLLAATTCAMPVAVEGQLSAERKGGDTC